MNEVAAIPEGIGPHEGRELELMLAGTKPLAMFGDALDSDCEFPEAEFAPYVADGTIVRREVVYRPRGAKAAGRFVYFARAGEEWRIDAMHRINEGLYVRGEAASPEVERQIGRLLGYGEDDIEQFIAWLEAFRARRKDA